MGYNRERIEKLERAIKEFLNNQNQIMDIEYTTESMICRCCHATGKIKINHKPECVISKLAKSLEENE